jgi:transcriptional regulator with XRE-family HTH domain
MPMMLTREQCRAARALLGWTQAELARRAGVACGTVRGFENGWHHPIRNNLTTMQAVMEAAGVMFIEPGEYGCGVRLRSPNGTTDGQDGEASASAGHGRRATLNGRAARSTE